MGMSVSFNGVLIKVESFAYPHSATILPDILQYLSGQEVE